MFQQANLLKTALVGWPTPSMTWQTATLLEILRENKNWSQHLPLKAATGGYGITVTSAPALKRQKARVTGEAAAERSDATAIL